MPQDVQTESFEYPAELFDRRVWHIAHPIPEPDVLAGRRDIIRSDM